MQVRWDRHFDAQRQMYRFCFTCETCRYFNGVSGTCMHEYPNEVHLSANSASAPPPDAIVFCKEYELA